MAWLFAVIILGVLAVALAVSSGKLGGQAPLMDQAPRLDLPARELTSDDLNNVSFDVVVRGYSPRQVDELLDRLTDQLSGKQLDDAKFEQVENDIP